MKKILTILAVAVLLTSCACDGGTEKCDTDGGHIDSTCVDSTAAVATTVTMETVVVSPTVTTTVSE